MRLRQFCSILLAFGLLLPFLNSDLAEGDCPTNIGSNLPGDHNPLPPCLPAGASPASPSWFSNSAVTGDMEWAHWPCDGRPLQSVRIIDAVFPDIQSAIDAGYVWPYYWHPDIADASGGDGCDGQDPEWPRGHFLTKFYATIEEVGPGIYLETLHHCLVPSPGHENEITPMPSCFREND